MSRFVCAGAILLFAASMPLSARAAVEVVNDFGVNGWYSWDTRSSTGTNLIGVNNTSPLHPGVPAPGADAAIEKQIKFLGENVVAADAAGNNPDPSPAGSLNGKGYVRLDGTNANAGKSDISFLSATGIGSATDLTDPSFFADYRFFTDSNPSSRTPGLNIGLIDPNDPTKVFTFSYVQTPYTANAWNTANVDGNSLFYLYGQGAPGGAQTKTLSDWFSDVTWGSLLQDDVIFRVGFNIGSSQRDSLIYLDWLSTSLLNGGDTIDFQAAVPEAGSLAIWSLLGVVTGCTVWRRRNK